MIESGSTKGLGPMIYVIIGGVVFAVVVIAAVVGWILCGLRREAKTSVHPQCEG